MPYQIFYYPKTGNAVFIGAKLQKNLYAVNFFVYEEVKFGN